MGTLTSTRDWSGREVAGVVLGAAVDLEDGSFAWDHPSLPSGTIGELGEVVTVSVGELVAPELAPPAPPITELEQAAGVARLEVVEQRDGSLELVALDAKAKPVDLDVVYAAEPDASVLGSLR